MTTHSHHDNINKQFDSQASAYLTSQVHASGRDLEHLKDRLTPFTEATVLDVGCGAGHASFVAASRVKEVIAYDLSEKMLETVNQAARERGFGNLQTRQGFAESLPFEDERFDIVISRYSAHHWQDVGLALREIKRVLRPGGKAIMMDVMSPGNAVLDIWLQTIEALRDTSHVRNYSSGEWAAMFSEAGLLTTSVVTDRLELDYTSWIARMRTPEALAKAIRQYQVSASQSVQQYYELQEEGSFTTDTIMIEVYKP